MFFLRYLTREISIHPSFFGSNLEQRLTSQLYADLEGSCNGEYYIVCIMDIAHISPGRVRPGSGQADFEIQYRAILWKPFRGETVDCMVTSVKSQGVFTECGPLTVFVSSAHLSPGMRYNPDATPVQYSTQQGDVIEKGSAVRVQIIGLRSDVNAMFGIGRMSGEHFG